MSDSKSDDAIIVTVLERMRTQRLPRALDIQEKVDAGGTLDDYDLAFLAEVLKDAEHTKPYVERHPELQEIAARMIHLYHEIVARALQNEGGGDPASREA